MKNIKRKIENTPSDYLKEFFRESNIFLSQRQPKYLLRFSATLPSPEIQVYLNEFLNAMIKDVKYARFSS